MDEILALVGVGGLIPTVVAAVSAWWSTAFSRRINKQAIEVTIADDQDRIRTRRPTSTNGSPPKNARPGAGPTTMTPAEADALDKFLDTRSTGAKSTRDSTELTGRRVGSTIHNAPAIRNRTDEYLRQVRSAQAQSTAFFWAYMISGCCGVVVVLAAASMVAFGNRDAAAATSIMGAVPVGITALFYKRSTDLDKMVSENLTRLSKADEIAEANRAAHDVVSRMGAGADQDRLLAMIGVRQLFPAATPAEVAELLHAVPIEPGTEQ
ncbi:hypothetical protein [Nocardia sp. NPDC058705]|uniref:TRADD-N-associated membrane domain-containing protein n=1 Tax=Nocardia sp. NPDC058705 TaxID=3346609 RepID=UPI00368C15EC